jgi:beta-lactamase superfamily II metal-dependent hydrolase
MAIKKKTSTKKTSTKKTAGKKTSNPSASDVSKVKVRMYNVGFGDSFLIYFPTEDGVRKVLIDCGVHPTGGGPRDIKEVAKQIIADVTPVGGQPSIDVVIATHRHADHVSGFAYEGWKAVTVKEVWMPWTEDYSDATAVQILEKQSRAAKKLKAKHAAAPLIDELAQNALVNAAAMKMLHEGFAGKPRRRYLPYKNEKKNSLQTPALPGVTVHVMGPSRDEKVIKDMEPKTGHSYVHLLQADPDEVKELRPFADVWSVRPRSYDKDLLLDPKTIRNLETAGTVDALLAAAALEDSVNGTSLMLMFNINNAYMLFPGDAQWGTWDAAINNPRWRELLAKTTFYKVGHHGSHNATPTDFLDGVLKDSTLLAAAMVCTRTEVNPTWDIPRGPLLKRLRKMTPNVVRSDEPKKTPKAFKRAANNDFVDYDVAV